MLNSIDTILGRITIGCSHIDRDVLNQAEWELSDFQMPFDSLNIILSGSAWITQDCRQYELLPGNVFLQKTGSIINRGFNSPENCLDILWIVFDVLSFEKIRLLNLIELPECCTGATAKRIQNLAHKALREWRIDRPGKKLTINGLILQILAIAYSTPARDILQPTVILQQRENTALTKSKYGQIRNAIAFIAEHGYEPMTLARLASNACLNPSYFSRLFHEVVGMPPLKFIESFRIREAERLLLNTDLLIRDISLATGYPDPYHFSRVFRRVNGQNPSAFRENINIIYPKRQ